MYMLHVLYEQADGSWPAQEMSTFHGMQQSDPKPSSIKVTDKKDLSELITQLVNYLESGKAKSDFDALATVQPLSPALQAM